ncbi:MAG: 16S rRNA (uracil(1498)-N(3))-methyltransferase, partial [Clostridiales Family XIII bacterium]|nr:16S rRNA (uracil(1498)-N(3))-methyltransferase [Clostridiales Family XIII bacterium]
MRRFFADPKDIKGDTIRIDSPSERNHIKNVLRMEIGDFALISDGVQYEYETQLAAFSMEATIFHILERRVPQAESRYHITLFQGIPKQGKLETIIQKATELGADAVVPVFMARSVPKPGSLDDKKLTRFRKIAAEASKQCGRGFVMQVLEAQ